MTSAHTISTTSTGPVALHKNIPQLFAPSSVNSSYFIGGSKWNWLTRNTRSNMLSRNSIRYLACLRSAAKGVLSFCSYGGKFAEECFYSWSEARFFSNSTKRAEKSSVFYAQPVCSFVGGILRIFAMTMRPKFSKNADLCWVRPAVAGPWDS